MKIRKSGYICPFSCLAALSGVEYKLSPVVSIQILSVSQLSLFLIAWHPVTLITGVLSRISINTEFEDAMVKIIKEPREK